MAIFNDSAASKTEIIQLLSIPFLDGLTSPKQHSAKHQKNQLCQKQSQPSLKRMILSTQWGRSFLLLYHTATFASKSNSSFLRLLFAELSTTDLFFFFFLNQGLFVIFPGSTEPSTNHFHDPRTIIHSQLQLSSRLSC